MQSFIHTTGKFLWWLTPELFKALVRLKFLPFVLGNILLKLKKNSENLYSKQHYFSKHHFTLLTKITESSEILQTLTRSDESGNSWFTAAKLHCPSYREKGINARQRKKKNILIKTTKILWLYVCRALNTAHRAGSGPLGSALEGVGSAALLHRMLLLLWGLAPTAFDWQGDGESCQNTTSTAPPAFTGTDAWQESFPSPSLAEISRKTGIHHKGK